ncbi:GGDEF domain-containing protein [Sulfurimonas sp. MAG313]|nr:EAL domain-containing protein [Sulfurimonas sp. MAG313]MDF1880851.1 GGDEF domain-containing protein [Sulfurimonas sp. MAG313]
MLYPHKKERSHRFLLALRTGLPLFILATLLMSFRLSAYFETMPAGFYMGAIFILAISIYFIFYMIYRGFNEQITDPITHTFTRQKVISILKEEIVKDKDYSIILISIENLADINSKYGTKAGDKVLKKVAREAGRFFENKGFDKFPIGHFKGGDFLIGLKGNYNSIRPFLEMMCIKFDDFIIDDMEIKVIGTIVDKSLSSDVLSLVERLFELKEMEMEEGEHIKTPTVDDISLFELEENIRYAITNRNFSLMFQPLEADEKIVQVSIKLQGKNDKIIHQKTFIPVIKRLGFEMEFDEILLEKILLNCKKLDKVTFAFNISPSVLRNKRFIQRFKQMVEKETIDFSRLIILLYEKNIYSNTKRYNDLLQDYRALGVRFCLDNVGAINSSIEYIKRLDIDIIRFDKAFSKNMDILSYASFLRAFIDISKDLKLKSWIKMVDTNELKLEFKEMNIDYIQGNVISKIISYEKLEEILD